MTEQLRQQYIRGLLREREGYQRKGDWHAVQLVDDELQAQGHELKPKHERAERRGRPPGSRNRPKPEAEPEVKPEGEAVADADQDD